MKKFLIIVIFILIILGAFYWHYGRFIGWGTYQNPEYSFQIRYPTLDTEVKIYNHITPDHHGIHLAYLDKTDNQYYDTFEIMVEDYKEGLDLSPWLKNGEKYFISPDRKHFFVVGEDEKSKMDVKSYISRIVSSVKFKK